MFREARETVTGAADKVVTAARDTRAVVLAIAAVSAAALLLGAVALIVALVARRAAVRA